MAEDLSGFSMLELFRLEAEGQTATLSAGVLAIEELDRSPQTVEAMMRAAHSLKGAARIVGLEPAVRVAHALEDVFVAAGRGLFRVRPEHADLLLAAVDFLGSIARADDSLAADGPWPARADALVGRLAAMLTAPADSSSATAASSPPNDVTPPLSATAPAGSATAEPPASTAVSAVDASAAAIPPAVGPPPHQATADQADRVVRVSADSLTRLVGLAGESLVETRQLRPFVDSLLQLRGAQVDLCDRIAAFEERLKTADVPLPATLAALLSGIHDRADACLARLSEQAEDFESFARRNEDLSNRLHHEVIASRMRPLADGIRGFPRLVRDLARSLGKQVRWEVRGEQTGVDRDILDKLEAPLSHLVRNALDHGLETPEERAAAGKPASGTIRLEARHRAGMLHITLADDGRGIDVESLRARAIARGLVARAVADQLTELELLEFLFLPGFSTKDRVTEISGRGVGLDVVQSMVKSVGGSVRVATQAGRQTVFTLQLPITMSVIRALLVEVGGEPYAFPLTRIDQILFCPQSDIRTVEGRQYFDRDGTSIGLVLAGQILEAAGGPPADPLPVVVISDRGQQFGMIVDAFLGERDLEVRPLDPRERLSGAEGGRRGPRAVDRPRPARPAGVAGRVREARGTGPAAEANPRRRRFDHGAGTGTAAAPGPRLRGRRRRRRDGRLERAALGPLRPRGDRRRHAAHGRHRPRVAAQGRPRPPRHPGRDRLLQGPGGGPPPRPRRGRQPLSHEEQFPRRHLHRYDH